MFYTLENVYKNICFWSGNKISFAGHKLCDFSYKFGLHPRKLLKISVEKNPCLFKFQIMKNLRKIIKISFIQQMPTFCYFIFRKMHAENMFTYMFIYLCLVWLLLGTPSKNMLLVLIFKIFIYQSLLFSKHTWQDERLKTDSKV